MNSASSSANSPPSREHTLWDNISWRLALIGFLVTLLCFELTSRGLYRSSLWNGPAFSIGILSSVADLRQRAALVESDRAILLGDSVLTGTVLRQHGYDDPTVLSLAGTLAKKLGGKGIHSVAAAADGMLVTDMVAVSTGLENIPFKTALVFLNVRMFAPEYEKGQNALAYPFLRPYLERAIAGSLGVQESLRAVSAANEAGGALTTARAYDVMTTHVALFRLAQHLKTLLYNPNPIDGLRRVLPDSIFPDEDPVLRESMLKLKMKPAYIARNWAATSTQFAALAILVRQLERLGAKVYVVFTPQNLAFLGENFGAQFQQNRIALREIVQALPSVHFIDLSDSLSSEFFLDHCHLTPEGIDRVAAEFGGIL